MKVLSLATLCVSLWFGSVLCRWCQVTTLRFCPSCFIFQQKWKKKSFCSKWIHLWGGSGCIYLSQFCGQRIQRHAGSINTLAKTFYTAPHDSKHPQNCQHKTNFNLLGENGMALYGVKQKVSQNQIRIRGVPSCDYRLASHHPSTGNCVALWYVKKLN